MTKYKKELIFQILVHLVVFVFYAIDRDKPSIEPYKYANFLNYTLTAGIINYFCLPMFYKWKNTFLFIAMILVCIFASALIEEYFVEKLFFVGKRADTIMMVYAFVDIIPVVGILVGLKFGWDAFGKQEEVERLEEAVKESELQFLKSQINPHFLFNNLNNLYSYALEGSARTPEIILELSGLLRYMLYECRQEYVVLSRELEQLENFVNLNTLQIENRGQVSFLKAEFSESYKIAPLILIVFVENAFKHSQNSQSDEIKIDIRAEMTPDHQLLFTCSNTYQSMTNTVHSDKGIGLQNVMKRLELIYPDKHELKIEDSNGTYTVRLKIDLSKSNQV